MSHSNDNDTNTESSDFLVAVVRSQEAAARNKHFEKLVASGDNSKVETP